MLKRFYLPQICPDTNNVVDSDNLNTNTTSNTNTTTLTSSQNEAEGQHILIENGNYLNKSQQNQLNMMRCYGNMLSQAHVFSGVDADCSKKLTHVVDTLNLASRIKKTGNQIENYTLPYQLARNIDNYHQQRWFNSNIFTESSQLFPDSTFNCQDKTIGYCNVLQTKHETVANYVDFCIEAIASRRITLSKKCTEKVNNKINESTFNNIKVKENIFFQKISTLLCSVVPKVQDELNQLIFHPDVMYLVACHFAKRVLLQTKQIRWFALGEFALSSSHVCLHQQNTFDWIKGDQRLAETDIFDLFTFDTFNSETRTKLFFKKDAYLTVVPLHKAEKIKIVQLNVATRENLHLNLNLHLVVSLCNKKFSLL